MKTSVKENYSSKTVKIPGNALVLGPNRWNEILRQLNKNEEEQNSKENEQNYQEYLRNGSKVMTNQWENSVGAMRAKKTEEKLKRDQEKIKEGERRYKELMENDERVRQGKLSNAQFLVDRLKVGPRQLESAAILSEVLKGQHEQRKINEENRRILKENHMQEGREIVAQAHQWMEEQVKKQETRKQYNGAYKSKLLDYAKQETEIKQENARIQAEFERKQREAADRELKEQIDRERARLEKKKETLRRNALEAVRVSEERRRREIEEDKICDKFINCYNEGKQKISELKRKTEEERRSKQINLKNNITKLIYHDQIENLNKEMLKKEEERIQKDSKEFEQKMKEKEREKKEYDKKMKAARIEQHLQEMEFEKKRKMDKLQQSQGEIANRLKNTEINFNYDKMKKENNFKDLTKNRNILLQQIDERIKKSEIKDYTDLEFMKTENVRDDKNFFEYANDLLQDAENKGRPVLPITRVVEFYKNHNRLLAPRDNPPHLKSNIPIARDCQHCAPFKYEIEELKKLNPVEISIAPSKTVKSWRAS